MSGKWLLRPGARQGRCPALSKSKGQRPGPSFGPWEQTVPLFGKVEELLLPLTLLSTEAVSDPCPHPVLLACPPLVVMWASINKGHAGRD